MIGNPSPQSQPMQIEDFSGGITDNYVDAPTNKSKRCDNFFITPNRKLKSRSGSELYDINNYQTPNGNHRVTKLVNFANDSDLLIGSYRDFFYIDGTWQKILGPTGNTVFSAGDFFSKIATAQWRKHLILTTNAFTSPQKIYRDQNGNYQLRTAGLPALSTPPTVTMGAAGVNSYIYGFAYRYLYNVETVEFLDVGPVSRVQMVNIAAPDSNAVNISNIPVLSNGANENWDTANIVVDIYRTINNGTTLLKIGQVTNGTTVFVDNFSDSAIEFNESAYINGGVLGNDPPPKARVIHIVNSKAYYGDILEGTQRRKNRILESVADDVDSVPAGNFTDLDEDVIGISSCKSVPIALCTKSIYRIDGQFDERGQGGTAPQRINDTAGCVSHESIVQTIDGIFWAGNDGFYYSDGYRVQKISNGFNDTYKSLVQNTTQKENIVGTYDEENNRIIWGVQKDQSSLDNDAWFSLDLRWGISDQASFTTASGGLSFQPSALVYYNRQLIRGDKHGYVFRHDDDLKTDPKIDVFRTPDLWGVQTIIWDYESAAMNFGTSFVRKWVPKMSVNAKNLSNLSLQIISNNDDQRLVQKLSPIRFRGNIFWGQIELVWGDPDIIWNKDGIIDQIRFFPNNSLRCEYKQVRMTNAYVVITNSDTLGTATLTDPSGPGVDPSIRYLDLDNVVDFKWPTDVVDYYVSFPDDDYAQEYLVDLRDTDTRITFIDSGNQSVAGAAKQWLLKGYPKGEIFYLNSFVIHYAPQTDTQRNFKATDTGTNA